MKTIEDFENRYVRRKNLTRKISRRVYHGDSINKAIQSLLNDPNIEETHRLCLSDIHFSCIEPEFYAYVVIESDEDRDARIEAEKSFAKEKYEKYCISQEKRKETERKRKLKKEDEEFKQYLQLKEKYEKNINTNNGNV